MDVYPMAALPQVSGGKDFETLIETVATPQFQKEVLRVANNIVGSAHVTAFSIADQGAPQIVLAADLGSSSLAYSASSLYVSRFWEQDPVNRRCFSEADLGRGVIVWMPTNEFQQIPYRRSCYSYSGWSSGGIHLAERLSIIRRRDGKTIRIDFYRRRDAEGYSEREVRLIASHADVLFALITRHALSSLPSQNVNSRAAYEQIIRRIAPHLPRREAEVCAGIVFGLSSEAIAGILGIGINTVLTYRKRAYARLQISSHNELIRFVFSSLNTLGVQVHEPLTCLSTKPIWQN
jgi:DNA-binding CsgD family transcriptional regulator